MKFQSTLLFASAALPAAFAQTWTACNPLEKSCPCDAALGTTYTFDFTKGKGSDIFPPDQYFKVRYESDGVHLPVTKKGDAPTIASTKFILEGRLDCILKIAPGKGIVSSLVFQSDDLDEIDYEWIGSKPLEAQSNYFGKGNTETYNRGATHVISSDAAQNFHEYSIDWTQEKIVWYLDGVAVRTLTPAKSAELYGSNNYYPQTPMQIKIGAWAAGDPSNEPGVIEWSDGPIDYKNGPFEMVVKSLTLTDYSTGATEYCYSDRTGSFGSIKVSKDPVKNVKSTSSAAAEKPSKTESSTTKPSTLSTSAAPRKATSTKVTTTMEVAPAVTEGVPDRV
jgi:beta-glucanase (GH16 family)